MTLFALLTTVFAAMAVAALAGWSYRRVHRDGGPRHTALPRHQDEWSSEWPTHPYGRHPIA